ncbi:hypothetical protein RJ55_07420 [Drechmeria coniospora]|nr:hypothetical protein RJ55_07420 [Drechmeria coniospora]
MLLSLIAAALFAGIKSTIRKAINKAVSDAVNQPRTNTKQLVALRLFYRPGCMETDPRIRLILGRDIKSRSCNSLGGSAEGITVTMIESIDRCHLSVHVYNKRFCKGVKSTVPEGTCSESPPKSRFRSYRAHCNFGNGTVPELTTNSTVTSSMLQRGGETMIRDCKKMFPLA